MGKGAVRFIFLLLVLGTPAGAATHKGDASKAVAAAHKLKRNADLADTINGTLILSKFAKLLQASDLGTFYSSRGPFTLFVPTNSAFSKLPPGMFEDLLRPENKTQLQRIVLFHLVNGLFLDSIDLPKLKMVLSCEGNPLPLKTSHSGVQYVAKARLLRADQKCANGVLNQVDTLLIPPKLGVLVSGPVNPAPDASTNAPPDNDSPASGADTNAAPDTSEKDPSVPAVPAVQ